MQDWAFGEAKAATGPWRPVRGLFFRGNEVMGVVQTMIRDLPLIGGGLVWINRGPLWRKTTNESPEQLAEMLGILRNHWTRSGYYLRVAPPIEGIFSVPNFKPTQTPGWASARVDLSLSPDTLRTNLQQKWRNALNKSERGSLKLSSGNNAFAVFLDGYSKFITKKNFLTSVTPDFISELQDSLTAEYKMTVYVVHHGGVLAGGALIARYGDTAEYLAGFATEASHRLNVGQILLWQAMMSARDFGLRWFDAGGMDEKRTPEGIYHFKAGLGGVPYRLTNEIEACPSDFRARLVRWRVRQVTMDSNS
jgi:hypothetical protein